MEFNETLHRQCNAKDDVIVRLRRELEELRGPLPDTFREATSGMPQEDNSQSLVTTHPLVHIWIPSAFLRGTHEAYHVYQV